MLILDSTTSAEYEAETTAPHAAQAVVDALSGTVTVKVYDGNGAEKASGTMAAPWAVQAGGVITVGELSAALTVSAAGPPDANWYLRFEAAGRWLRGSFGLVGSDADFRSTSDAWVVGHTGRLGTVVITAAMNAAPSLIGAPSSLSFMQGVGGSYNFGQFGTDPEGDAISYSLVGTAYSGITIHVTTGVLAVTAAATSATRNLTVRVTDAGGLSSDWACAVTIYEASAATYVIPTSTSARTFDGGSANGFAGAVWRTTAGATRLPQGGDVIELAAGTHGPLAFRNLQGVSDASRITVRNGNGQVTITSGVTNVVTYAGCHYVNFVFDRAGQQYGLKVSAVSAANAPEKCIKAEGDNTYVRWSHFELDGKQTVWTSAVQPIGFFGHHQNTQRSGGLFQQDHIVVERFYVHHMAGEGIYFGPNFSNGSRPLRNIEVAHGLITDCGRDGAQGKCWFEGANSMHDLEVRRCGRNTADSQAGQRHGLAVGPGKANCWNNRLYECGESGIQLYVMHGPDTVAFDGYGPYTSFDCTMYNNLIVDSGVIDNAPVNIGHGITLGADSPTRCLPRGYAYNNTIVGSEGRGIAYGTNTNAGWIRNNVLVDNADGPYLAAGSSATNNKTSGSLTTDYRLTAEDAAVGTLGTDISATDLDGVSRSGTASKGAYEYS